MDPWDRVWVDYYEELGISPSATPRVIEAAWRAMARDFHPDAGGSEDRMKSINVAFDVLSDPYQRQRCDHAYKVRNSGSQGRPGSSPAPEPPSTTRSSAWEDTPPSSESSPQRGRAPSANLQTIWNWLTSATHGKAIDLQTIWNRFANLPTEKNRWIIAIFVFTAICGILFAALVLDAVFQKVVPNSERHQGSQDVVIRIPTRTPWPTETPQPTWTPRPTRTPRPTETPRPTRTPTPGPTLIPVFIEPTPEIGSMIRYYSPTESWTIESGDWGATFIQDQTFHMNLNRGWENWIGTSLGYNNSYSFSLDLRMVSAGARASEACLIIHTDKDSENVLTYYGFCISSFGQLRAGYQEEFYDGSDRIDPEMVEVDLGVRKVKPEEFNTLAIISAGDDLWFLWNGVPVGYTGASKLSFGQAGMMVKNQGTFDIEWEFKDLIIQEVN